MKKLILLTIFCFNSFASDCSFSLRSVYKSNIQGKLEKRIDELSDLEKTEKYFIWNIGDAIERGLDCRYTSNYEQANFQVQLNVFEFYKKIEYLGLIFKEEKSRTTDVQVDYNNKHKSHFPPREYGYMLYSDIVNFMRSQLELKNQQKY